MIAFIILVALIVFFVIASVFKAFGTEIVGNDDNEGCVWLVGIIVGIFAAFLFCELIKSCVVD